MVFGRRSFLEKLEIFSLKLGDLIQVNKMEIAIDEVNSEKPFPLTDGLGTRHKDFTFGAKDTKGIGSVIYSESNYDLKLIAPGCGEDKVNQRY